MRVRDATAMRVRDVTVMRVRDATVMRARDVNSMRVRESSRTSDRTESLPPRGFHLYEAFCVRWSVRARLPLPPRPRHTCDRLRDKRGKVTFPRVNVTTRERLDDDGGGGDGSDIERPNAAMV